MKHYLLLALFFLSMGFSYEKESPTFPLLNKKSEEQPREFFLKGIILVPDEKSFIESKMGVTKGLKAFELQIPGGVKKLEKKLSHFLNRNIDYADLLEIKKNIICYFRERGYPVVTIHIPPQDISKCFVVLIVKEARLGEIIVEKNCYFKSKTLRNYIELRPGDRIDEKTLLKNLGTINSNPFRSVDLIFTPGKQEGTTDIKLLTEDHFPLRVYTGFENNGVNLTKSNRWFVGFNWGNVFLLDQQFSYQYTTSFDFETFQAHTAQYIAPLPWWNHLLTLYGGYSSVHTKLPQIYEKSKSKGQSGQASLRYQIPLPAGNCFLQNLSLGVDFKRTDNSLEYDELSPIFGGAVNLTQMVLGYQLLYDKKNYKASFTTDLFISPGEWILDQTNARYQLFRYKARNKYFYIKTRFENLITLPRDFVLSTYIDGQYSNQNLLPSEMYEVGGAHSVRGYEERILNGDDGVTFSLEARSPILNWHKKVRNEGIRLLTFFDFGLALPHHQLPHEKNWQYLAGIGPGIRYAVGSYFSTTLDFGIKLHHADDLGKSKGRLHFNVILAY